MPNKFAIKNCPLCNSLLEINYPTRDGYRFLSSEKTYYCPVVIKYEPPEVDGYGPSGLLMNAAGFFKSHYEVAAGGVTGTYQSVILDSFMLITGLNETFTSVYKFPNLPTCLDKFLIMTVPVLTLEAPEHLTKRLKNLVIFS